MKKALVTGGAGFIGSTVVRALLDLGVSVRVLDDLSTGTVDNLDGLRRVEFLQGDVCDASAVIHAIAGVDTVFHLAASVGNKRSLDNPSRDAQVNLLGTIQVLEACRAARVEKIVYSSSAGIFGELKTLPIAEDHPLVPETPYGVTKLAAEKMCLAYTQLYDIRAVCLRYFNVYGPRQRFDAYGNVIPKFVFTLLKGGDIEVYGDGQQTRDFVHARDVAQANVKAALATEVTGVFNIGSGTRVTINDLIRILRANGLEFSPTTGPTRSGDVRDSLADISSARMAFGYKPSVDLARGVGEYVAWAKGEMDHKLA
ncbi:NAD-dependent epimerase/dehydratase family protein [Geothrix sp.]|uniref:NAD-dependent epimerase/dehydratase family protein n=1 Tax=Geothrix sp. TaxID=1962974 RepID=UPI0025BD4D19|nr:NAD-dependent epimerase/dehydratase family protein [Geothrix sp.]